MKRKHAIILFTVIALVLLALDRITKNIAIEVLTDNGPIAFLPAFLDFALVYNTGGAFGVFEGGAVFFVGVAVIALVVIIVYLIKAKDLRLPIVIALAMISAGALGNAYDRAVSGAVPDFIHTLFIDFPVFNVADICLTVGEILLIVFVAIMWFGPQNQQEEGDAHHVEAAFTGDEGVLEATSGTGDAPNGSLPFTSERDQDVRIGEARTRESQASALVGQRDPASQASKEDETA